MQGLIFLLFLIALVSLALYRFRRRLERDQLRTRLELLQTRRETGREVHPQDPASTPGIKIKREIFRRKLWQGLARFSGKLPFPVHPEQLTRANLQLSAEEFQAIRLLFFSILSFIIFALGGLMFFLLSLLPCAFLSWYLPLLYLRKRERARQEYISESMPEFIDLLTIFLIAGQNLNQALPRAAASASGPLQEELLRTLNSIELGMPRTKAFQELSLRNPSTDLRRFCRVVLRAERFGSPLAAIMEGFSSELRNRRKNRLQERAHKAPVKILFPLVFLILPSFLLLTVGGMILGGHL